MPILAMMFPIVFGFVFAIFAYSDGKNKIGTCFLTLALCAIGWIVFSACQPLKVYRAFDLKVDIVDNTAAISYTDWDGNLKIVNLNEELQQNIPPGAKVRVTVYEPYYAGLMYDEPMVEDKYEVLTTED